MEMETETDPSSPEMILFPILKPSTVDETCTSGGRESFMCDLDLDLDLDLSLTPPPINPKPITAVDVDTATLPPTSSTVDVSYVDEHNNNNNNSPVVASNVTVVGSEVSRTDHRREWSQGRLRSSHSRRPRERNIIRLSLKSPRTADIPSEEKCSWRKYGQKKIKDSPHPRCYYKCSTFKRCPAKKQVQRDEDHPSILNVTYEHEHKHY